MRFNCDCDNFSCVDGSCSNCVDYEKKLRENIKTGCLDKKINYKKWDKLIDNRFVQKMSVEISTVEDVILEIAQKMTHMIIHLYLKNVQNKAFSESKKNQQLNSVTMIIDFSENYSTISQNEVQSSYFGRAQLSIFTCVCYLMDKTENYALICNDTCHSKYYVYT